MTEIASVASSAVPTVAVAETAAPAAFAASAASAAASVAVAAAKNVEPPAKTQEGLQKQIDRVLEDTDTSLRFRVDDESKRIVVSVLDGAGEVILQIPDEAALEVARRFASTGSLLELKA